MQHSKNDLWVGLFVLLGGAALVFLALQSANLLSLNFRSGYVVTARFDNIGGLKPKAAVRSAGVVVGRVEAITFDDKTLAMTGSSLSYRPKATAMFDFYQSNGDDDVQVTIDRFERNADGTYAITGSFSAKDLPASSMAKKLPSASLKSASGTFSFEALPLKEMPKFGKGG